MTAIGETIAAKRREKGMTQEELGRAVGVSMQAVSKWENGGVPDVALLPGIADVLGVSIDALFGRCPASADIEQALAREIHRLSDDSGAQLRRMLELYWAMQRSMFSSGSINPGDTIERFQPTHSQNLMNEGISLMRLNEELSYAFIAPTPACGWRKQLVQRDRQLALFRLLGQPDSYDVLMFLHSRDDNPFTARFVEKHTGVPAARVEELMGIYEGYGLVSVNRLALDEDELTVYRAHSNPALVPLLAFSLELIEWPHSFCFQNGMRDKPFLAE